MRPLLLCLAVALLARPAGAAPDDARPPIIAVMTLEAVGVKLPAAVLDRLTVFLTGRLGATGWYQVVPREQVKKRLVELKKESYADDCDQTCQIELGKRVVAQKTVTTQVVKAGDSCSVNLNVFDLEREASEGGASIDGACDENGIVASLKAAVAQLVATRKGETAAPPPVSAPPPVEDAGPTVRKGAVKAVRGDLTVSAKTRDGTPVRLDLVDPSGRALASGSPFKDDRAAVGTWQVTARATGHEEVTRTIQVGLDSVVSESIDLKPLGGLRVTGEPEGAAVKVTGPGGFRDEGGLPWEAERLKSGTYRVEVSRPGYEAAGRTVQVEPGRVEPVEVTLQKDRPEAGAAAGDGGQVFPGMGIRVIGAGGLEDQLAAGLDAFGGALGGGGFAGAGFTGAADAFGPADAPTGNRKNRKVGKDAGERAVIYSGTTSADGALGKEPVRRYVRTKMDQVRWCYAQELQRNPDLAGQVKLEWVILPGGKVTGTRVVQSSLDNAAVEACLVSRVSTWLFPSAEGITRIVYPFIFRTGK